MDTPTLLEQLTGVSFSDPVQAALLGGGFAAVIVIGQAAFKIRQELRDAALARSTRAPRRPVRPDMVVTIIGAALILALSIEGMWRFFGAIGMPVWGRIAFAAVFEICLLAVALRARHIRLQRQARRNKLALDLIHSSGAEADRIEAGIAAIRLRGINDVLVWVFAAAIGVLAALEAPTRPEQIARFIVPFFAATMWELALGADVEDQRVTAVAKTWGTKLKALGAAVGRFFVSVAITFGWVPPTSANASTKFREKLMTRLVAVSHQIHTTAGEVKASLLKQQRELILDLQARGQWGEDTMAELGTRLDALYRAVEFTAPAAVRPRSAAQRLPAAAPARPAYVELPALPAATATSTAPAQSMKRRRRAGQKFSPTEFAAAYQRLYVNLGKAPSVTELGNAGAWSRSKAGLWMKQNKAELPALEAEALTEAAAELEGASS